MKNQTVFTVGAFAYYDTFAGLIPCKVIGISDVWPAGHELHGKTSGCRVIVKLTANRGAYARGEEITSDALRIIPRPFVRGNRILGGYSWEAPKVID